ncbi:MAG: hypothetical protein LBM69_02595 [Lachnospiraceae bacterium]|jgi:hypothetical protein|nr:hypothetical protein [Lachnospiraceae bacterium]
MGLKRNGRNDKIYFENGTTTMEMMILVIGGSIITALTYRRSCYDAKWKFYELEISKEQISASEAVAAFPSDYLSFLTEG